MKPLLGYGSKREHHLKCDGFTPKNAKNGKNRPPAGTWKVGPRCDTGRFEASIYPYNYPEELGAIPDFDRTSNSLGLPLSSLRGRKNG